VRDLIEVARPVLYPPFRLEQHPMWKKIVLAVVAAIALLVVAVLGYVALQPADFRVSRSVKMAAPAEEIFAQVDDFHKWDAWSPWVELDPHAKYSFEGPISGPGAIFRWDGNENVGTGSMTITETRPPELIRIQLAFVKPFEDVCDTEMTFQPDGGQTNVTWTMSGKNNFVGRLVCLFMDMDTMVGDKYDAGLAKLKAIVEAPAGAAKNDESRATNDEGATKTE
jgi:hypothetical protein